jgi:predicted transcriptional regulator
MRRGRLEIYRDILNACYKGERKSVMMTKCRVSWAQIKEVLPYLIERGFIEIAEENVDKHDNNRKVKVYRVTAKGAVLLMALENVDRILEKTENCLKPPIFLLGGATFLYKFYLDIPIPKREGSVWR